MGYRDEREAERARIEALERDLADANERAARAEADAAAAREEASAAQQETDALPARAEGSKRPKKSRAERKRDKARRAAAASADSSATPAPWSSDRRRRYFRISYALSLVAYWAVGAAVASGDGEDAMTLRGAVGAAVAIVALFGGHLVIGRLTRAPGIFNGAGITLIGASVSLGGAIVALISVDDLASSVRSAPLPFVARAVVVVVALGLGAYVTAFWSSDAAQSGTSGD